MNDVIETIRHRGKFYIEYEKLRDYLNNHISDEITTLEESIKKLEEKIDNQTSEFTKRAIADDVKGWKKQTDLWEAIAALHQYLNIEKGLVEKKK